MTRFRPTGQRRGARGIAAGSGPRRLDATLGTRDTRLASISLSRDIAGRSIERNRHHGGDYKRPYPGYRPGKLNAGSKSPAVGGFHGPASHLARFALKTPRFYSDRTAHADHSNICRTGDCCCADHLRAAAALRRGRPGHWWWGWRFRRSLQPTWRRRYTHPHYGHSGGPVFPYLRGAQPARAAWPQREIDPRRACDQPRSVLDAGCQTQAGRADADRPAGPQAAVASRAFFAVRRAGKPANVA